MLEWRVVFEYKRSPIRQLECVEAFVPTVYFSEQAPPELKAQLLDVLGQHFGTVEGRQCSANKGERLTEMPSECA